MSDFKRGSAPSRGTLGSLFTASVSQKRLELKSLKRQTKAEELGAPHYCEPPESRGSKFIIIQIWYKTVN
jgi:hypothetical protein